MIKDVDEREALLIGPCHPDERAFKRSEVDFAVEDGVFFRVGNADDPHLEICQVVVGFEALAGSRCEAVSQRREEGFARRLWSGVHGCFSFRIWAAGGNINRQWRASR